MAIVVWPLQTHELTQIATVDYRLFDNLFIRKQWQVHLCQPHSLKTAQQCTPNTPPRTYSSELFLRLIQCVSYIHFKNSMESIANMNETEADLTEKRLKVVLVGDSSAGKLIIFVYDVTNTASFDAMEEWMATVVAITERSFQKSPLMVIVGNKCDMEHQRTVKRDKSHRYAAEKGLIYHDMSARTGESVSLSIANLSAKVLGVQLTRMDQEFHKPIVTAEIGDTVDVATIRKVIKRQPHRKSCQNNNYPALPLSKSAVCSLQ
ncbi:uncharacterized protein LOC135162694 isoform X2 [Diachasmimorpha longicaudata]|uniref:uncharacterized protein LOC135162694 isoform X2 n=1 Tax=Diachasmimorpha longicaudata TaxID=58733 RepID=UPI0030B8D34D